MEKEKSQLIVLGGGPGGYTAAFYAADRGLKVTLVDNLPRLGGVCMNHGCIPSKALLQSTASIETFAELKERGIHFDKPRINPRTLNDWKNKVVHQLGGGLKSLAESRGVRVLKGRGSFSGETLLRVETEDGQTYLEFEHAIIATGSKAALPDVFDLGNPRVMTSREALEVDSIPEKLLVVGGGYIGLELGTVYARLGAEVSLLEAMDQLLPGTDKDLEELVARRARRLLQTIQTGARVEKLSTSGERIEVEFSTSESGGKESFDKVLVAVGRLPNTDGLGLSECGVETGEKGFISVDDQGRTSNKKIFAIGDVSREPLLAHKAVKEGRVAVDAIFGEASSATDYIVPAIVYTDPELAWCGLTETEAREKDIDHSVSIFSWKASGRALAEGRTDGLTKLVVDSQSERLLGVGICGHGAADLIAEGVVALEMGASVRDLAEMIHPHPTLSETLKEAAEHFFGTATHQGRKS